VQLALAKGCSLIKIESVLPNLIWSAFCRWTLVIFEIRQTPIIYIEAKVGDLIRDFGN
jgi:hypothetical protein